MHVKTTDKIVYSVPLISTCFLANLCKVSYQVQPPFHDKRRRFLTLFIMKQSISYGD
jgi:hypothetical protein